MLTSYLKSLVDRLPRLMSPYIGRSASGSFYAIDGLALLSVYLFLYLGSLFKMIKDEILLRSRSLLNLHCMSYNTGSLFFIWGGSPFVIQLSCNGFILGDTHIFTNVFKNEAICLLPIFFKGVFRNK